MMEKKEFNYKLYGILSILVVALILSALTVRTFVTRYNAFSPEKTAVAYVDTIVESGDGYNAFKNSLLSKNSKFGDFIRANYIYPEIYEGYKPGDSTKGLRGLNDESLKNENSLNDNGSLEGKLINAMYPYFKELIEQNGGWDNYDIIFKSYITKLKETRNAVFGDNYFDDETFFTCIESNSTTYGEALTGTEDEFDKNTGVQLKTASTGAYQVAYGDNYRFDIEVKGEEKSEIIADAEKYGIDSDSIKEEKAITLQVKCGDTPCVEEIKIYVVKIGNSWFVDNLNTDTSVLYTFYK